MKNGMKGVLNHLQVGDTRVPVEVEVEIVGSWGGRRHGKRPMGCRECVPSCQRLPPSTKPDEPDARPSIHHKYG